MRPSLYEQLALTQERAHEAALAEEQRQRALAQLRYDLAGLELDLAVLELRRALGRKYDPNQPRVPSGQPGGGQWTDGSSGTRESKRVRPESIIARAKRLALKDRPDAYQSCLDLCYRYLNVPQPPWSDRNENDFHKCMNACLGRNL